MKELMVDWRLTTTNGIRFVMQVMVRGVALNKLIFAGIKIKDASLFVINPNGNVVGLHALS
jgi:hypothetical protein